MRLIRLRNKTIMMMKTKIPLLRLSNKTSKHLQKYTSITNLNHPQPPNSYYTTAIKR